MFTNKDVVLDPTTTSTSQMAPDGAFMWYTHPTYGQQLYRQVQNKDASAATVVGCAYSFSANDVNSVDLAGAADEKIKVAGIAQTIIATDSWGWLLCRGMGQVKSQADYSAGEFLGVVGADGKLDNVAASHISAIAKAFTAAGGVNVVGTAIINIF